MATKMSRKKFLNEVDRTKTIDDRVRSSRQNNYLVASVWH